MDGHEVGRADQVGSGQGVVAEAQVRAGVTARFLRVVVEVGLAVFVGVVADNLDAVLVGTHRAVGTEAVEAGLEGALGQDADFGQQGQRTEGYVVDDADGELVLLLAFGVVEDADDLGGSGVLAGETVAAAEDGGLVGAVLEGLDDVHIQRVAVGAGLLGAVEDGDGLHVLHQALGHSLHQVFHAEGAVQVDGHAAGLLALGVEVIHHGLDGLGHRAHSHDDVLGILGTVVGEGGVLAARQFADLSHILGHDVGQSVIVLVLQLAGLEVNVAVLCGAAGHVVLGVEGVLAESLQGLLVHERTQVFHIPGLDFLDLVAGAEAVEEVEERHAALEGAEVGHRGEVHHLLHRALGQHGEARLAGSHHVGVVAEDGEGLGGQGAGAHVEHAGQQFAGDLVHIRDHQQQTL